MKILDKESLSKLSNDDLLEYTANILDLFCNTFYPENTHPFMKSAFNRTFRDLFVELFARLHV